jgi:hypothetical protein
MYSWFDFNRQLCRKFDSSRARNYKTLNGLHIRTPDQ